MGMRRRAAPGASRRPSPLSLPPCRGPSALCARRSTAPWLLLFFRLLIFAVFGLFIFVEFGPVLVGLLLLFVGHFVFAFGPWFFVVLLLSALPPVQLLEHEALPRVDLL